MLKVGDKVRIRRDLKNIRYTIEANLPACHFIEKLIGTIQEVESISGHYIRLKDVRRYWDADMLEPLPTQSIHITTDGTTVHAIQKEDGKVTKRSKAVCSPTDTFDFAVGAKLALERLFELTGGVREVSRHAKVGEWVKVVTSFYPLGYQEGNVFRVEAMSAVVKGRINLPHVVLAKEYVVLENYTPPNPEPPTFTFDQFRAGKLAVHCDTESKASEFLAYLHGKGLAWRGGDSLMGKTLWDDEKEATCYDYNWGNSSGAGYSGCSFYKSESCTLIPYNAADLD